MLEHESDLTFAGAARERVFAVERDLAGIRPVEPGDNPQQRSLARARRPEQRQQFAVRGLQVDTERMRHNLDATVGATPEGVGRPKVENRQRALTALRPYETSGRLSIPLVTLHTTGDDVIPIWQELLYLLKFDPSGRGRFIPVPVLRYGHCNFTTNEVLDAFLLTVKQP